MEERPESYWTTTTTTTESTTTMSLPDGFLPVTAVGQNPAGLGTMVGAGAVAPQQQGTYYTPVANLPLPQQEVPLSHVNCSTLLGARHHRAAGTCVVLEFLATCGQGGPELVTWA